MAGLSEEYQQLPPIARFILGVLVCGLVFYYFYGESIEPRSETLEEKKQAIEKLEIEFKQISAAIITPITLEEELTKANREHKKILEQLPTEPSIEKILNEFASISRLTGTEINEFMPEKKNSTSATPVQETTAAESSSETSSSEISLKMSGTFTSIVSFLDMTMTIPRVIRMSDFELINPEKELKLVQRPKLEFNGKFLAYFQKNPRPATQPDAAVATEEENVGRNRTDEIAKGAIDLNGLFDKSMSAK